MERYVRNRGSSSVEELCQQFDVSISTVRRDIAELIRRRNVYKVYDGITAR
jgi:DeoR family myo-inositol catabolism operon transcriptional repressor